MKALIFDLDDTLYDQIQPFKQAIEEKLQPENLDMEALYLAFRRQADIVFDAVGKGEMTLERSHILRMKAALAEFDITVSDEEALALQKAYQSNQGNLELVEGMTAIFEWCASQGIVLGIITNGPHLHQWRKFQALGLSTWFSEELTLISGQFGSTKPQPQIFHEMERRLQLSASDICYIGDSFENDVVGAKQVGWQVIWVNHRKRQMPASIYQADQVVENLADIFTAIQTLANL